MQGKSNCAKAMTVLLILFVLSVDLLYVLCLLVDREGGHSNEFTFVEARTGLAAKPQPLWVIRCLRLVCFDLLIYVAVLFIVMSQTLKKTHQSSWERVTPNISCICPEEIVWLRLSLSK